MMPAAAGAMAPAHVPVTARARAGERLAPLMIGAMAGAVVAARLDTAAACVAIALACAMAAGARRPPALLVMTGLLGVTLAALLNIYLTPGLALEGPRLFGRAPTAEGLRDAGIVVARLVAAAAAIQGLRAAWSGDRGADAMARMLGPLQRVGVPVRELRTVLGLAIRFAPLLAHEWDRTGRLQAMRAGRPPRTLAERLQRRRATLVPTLTGAFERADRTALALDARHHRVRPLTAGPHHHAATVAGWALFGVALLWR